ncbi:MAG: hypothetical protein ACYC1D_19500 [Acidimicrobiales bacterium]
MSAVAVHACASVEVHTVAVVAPPGAIWVPATIHGWVVAGSELWIGSTAGAGGATTEPKVAVAPPPMPRAALVARVHEYGPVGFVVVGGVDDVVVGPGAAVAGVACGALTALQAATPKAIAAAAASALHPSLPSTGGEFARHLERRATQGLSGRSG